MRTKEVVVLFWAVLCLGLLACFSQSSPSRQQQIESHNRKAAEYLKQNRPDLAVPEFKAIVALDPNNVDARGNLGVVLFFQGDYTNCDSTAPRRTEAAASLVEDSGSSGHRRKADGRHSKRLAAIWKKHFQRCRTRRFGLRLGWS